MTHYIQERGLFELTPANSLTCNSLFNLMCDCLKFLSFLVSFAVEHVDHQETRFLYLVLNRLNPIHKGLTGIRRDNK